jgi:hypothetical protein
VKQINTTAVTFTAAAKTVDFSGWASFDSRRLLAVVNVTVGKVLYAPGSTAYTGTFAGSVLTFTTSNAGMANGDVLSIDYDPTDVATETTLAAFSAKFNSLGQKTMVNSAPMVIASDQTAVPISATSLPLPTGAATETTLAAFSAKFSSLGQKAMAASAPVVIASDQSAVPVSGTVAVSTLPSVTVGNFPAGTLENGAITLLQDIKYLLWKKQATLEALLLTFQGVIVGSNVLLEDILGAKDNQPN